MSRPFRTPYPGYDVLAKWNTPSWNDATRQVVAHRLHEVPARCFFGPEDWHVLEALCACVMPQDEREDRVPIAAWIDQDCLTERTTGTRYAELPPMREVWPRALRAIDEEARARHGAGFAALERADQEAVLGAIDAADVRADAWRDLPPRRVLRDVLLKEIVSVYYAHPAAWSEIGFGGPASPRGYVRLAANHSDPWEAKEEPAEEPEA